MSIFGWSYPPGCSGPPEDHDTCLENCVVCGKELDQENPAQDYACSDACKAAYKKQQDEAADAEARGYAFESLMEQYAKEQGVEMWDLEIPAEVSAKWNTLTTAELTALIKK